MVIVTTYLEMLSPSQLRPKPHANPHFFVREATVKQWRFNKWLYEAVGKDWSWFDKSNWTDEQWRAYAEAPELRTFAASYDGSPAGYYELRDDGEGGVEIVYFGLLPAFVGQGYGAALLTSALEEAWKMNPKRVWLHTCNLDHPGAISNYEKRGMRVYKIEKKEAGA